MTDPVTASAHACSMGGSQVWLKEGEVLTVEEMLKCIVIASANDCAVAMAEHLGGTEEAFVQQMNERAVQLGMNDTHFVNCCGLYADGHVTSAYDIALMSAELLRHKGIQKYTTIWQDTIRDGAFTLTNTNKLIKAYTGMTGLKTGSTSTAGFCLSGTAEREGLELIAVVLKGESSKTRNADVASMLNYGFANFAAVTPTTDQPLLPIPVSLGKSGTVSIELKCSEPLILSRAQLGSIEKEVILEDELAAPVEQGQQVGTLRLTAGEETLAELPIVTTQSVERQSIWDLFTRIIRFPCMQGQG